MRCAWAWPDQENNLCTSLARPHLLPAPTFALPGKEAANSSRVPDLSLAHRRLRPSVKHCPIKARVAPLRSHGGRLHHGSQWGRKWLYDQAQR